MLIDFGKKLLVGLFVAACLIGAHAAIVHAVLN